METMHQLFHRGVRIFAVILAVFLTILTVSCGKNDSIKKNKVENEIAETDKFSTNFFYDCNLPYEKLQSTDVQNSAEEYLFYINHGCVYRTLHDNAVVIVARSEIREPSDKIGTNYSGELYQIFEDDEFDVLKYSASGDYAIMAALGAVSNWEEDEVIIAFMEYAANYQSK